MRSETSEFAANEALHYRSKSTFRQLDDCYRISQPIARRGLLARLWASIVNFL